MKLLERKYTYKEIKEFEKIAKTKDCLFLLQHVSALRILGWKLILPKKISHKYINGFSDVVRVDRTLNNKFILYTGRDYGKNKYNKNKNRS